jgi:hypothetical protein
MARINIEDCWWTDPRRSALSRLVGETRADGIAVRAWRLGQDFWKHGRGLIPKELFDCLDGAAELIQSGLAEVRASFVYVRGSSAYLDWVAEKREQAKVAGKKSAEVRRKKRGSAQPNPRTTSERSSNERRTKSNDAEPSVSGSFSDSISDSGSKNIAQAFASEVPTQASVNPNGESAGAKTWRAYKAAYQEKYGEAPAWNAKTAGQLKSFVSRIPATEAPDVAAFYVTHKDRFYVQAMHPVGLLLRDAEKLRTEWATGRQMTGVEARQGEKTSAYQSQLDRIAKGEL